MVTSLKTRMASIVRLFDFLMGYILRYTIAVFSIFFCILFLDNNSYAQEYRYDFAVDPPISHFVVKPDFNNFGTEFSIKNGKDPVYMQLRSTSQDVFNITIYRLDEQEKVPIDLKDNTFLLLPGSSTRFTAEISRSTTELAQKDYSIDLIASFKLIQIPKDIQKSVVLEPRIHKQVVLSVTKDGNMPLDPKIALFQNTNGPVSLSTNAPKIVTTVQNRGNYSFAVSGTLSIVGPSHYKEVITIPMTYVFANGQKNLSVVGALPDSPIIIPNANLKTGQYTATIDLVIPGTNTPRLYSSTSFWLISPNFVIASIVFCFIMIIIVFYVGLRHT